MMETSPPDALQAYTQLRSVYTTILSEQEASKGQTPRFLDYVENVTLKLKDLMRESYSNEFQRVLDKMKWPAKEQPPEDLIRSWAYWCEFLLELQEQ